MTTAHYCIGCGTELEEWGDSVWRWWCPECGAYLSDGMPFISESDYQALKADQEKLAEWLESFIDRLSFFPAWTPETTAKLREQGYSYTERSEHPAQYKSLSFFSLPADEVRAMKALIEKVKER